MEGVPTVEEHRVRHRRVVELAAAVVKILPGHVKGSWSGRCAGLAGRHRDRPIGDIAASHEPGRVAVIGSVTRLPPAPEAWGSHGGDVQHYPGARNHTAHTASNARSANSSGQVRPVHAVCAGGEARVVPPL